MIFAENGDPRKQNISAWPDLGINYWGVTKCATSTIIAHLSLLSNSISELEIVENFDQKSKIKAHSDRRYISCQTAFQNGLQNFGIVRNPVDRFYSCYRHFKYPANDGQQRTSDRAEFVSTWTINDFLNNVANMFGQQKMYAGNNHYWKQSWYIHSIDKMDYILKLEDIDELWPLDIKNPVLKLNQTTKVTIDDNLDIDLLKKVYKEDFENFGY